MKYLRYYFKVMQLSFMASAMYRADHYLRYVRISLEFGISLFTITTLFDHTQTLAFWTKSEMFVIYSVWTLTVCIYYFFSANSNYKTSRDIRDGKIDQLFTKPLDSQFLASFRSVHTDNIYRVIGGVATFFYAIHNLPIHWSPILIAIFLMQILGGVLILYCFMFSSVIITFFSQGNEQVTMFESLMLLGKFPTDIFPSKYLFLFWTAIPLAYFSTIPTKTLLGKSDSISLAISLIAPVIFLFLLRNFWNLALRHYSSASS